MPLHKLGSSDLGKEKRLSVLAAENRRKDWGIAFWIVAALLLAATMVWTANGGNMGYVVVLFLFVLIAEGVMYKHAKDAEKRLKEGS